jgi:serine/threonine-protein kinase HipA
MSKLYVYFENKKIGVLERDKELVHSFQYTKEWIDDSMAFPLSLVLPLTNDKFGNKLTLSFFENLLPEGDVKKSLEKGQYIHGEFEFLEKFGKDCAGAVSVTADEHYKFQQSDKKLIKIEIERIYKAIEEKRSVAEEIAESSPGYLSLAGAQDKFPAVFKKNEFYLPKGGHPTTHIVKVPIWRNGVKDSVFNELYCMQLAQTVGLNVPNSLVINGKQQLYVVERYDRQIDPNGVVHRIHQEDFCQAQGITSEFKYEGTGGPTIASNYELILKHVTPLKRVYAIKSYFRWIMFNLIIGNNDSHSKNISLLLNNGKIELAPFYDLLCSAIYPKIKRKFSFNIGDRNDFSRIGKNQFEQQEDQMKLKRGTLTEALKEMSELLLSNKDKVVEQITKEYGKQAIAGRISDLIKDRSKSLKIQKALK